MLVIQFPVVLLTFTVVCPFILFSFACFISQFRCVCRLLYHVFVPSDAFVCVGSGCCSVLSFFVLSVLFIVVFVLFC